MVIKVNSIQIPDHEIQFQFVRASGPGGQNVNKLATAAQLRFDIVNSPSLSQGVRDRLLKIGGSRVSRDGVLVIDARRFRTQERNRADALERFTELLARAAHQPKKRVRTKPSKAAKERRLQEKRQAGARKISRRRPRMED